MYRITYTDVKYNVRRKFDNLDEAVFTAIRSQRPLVVRSGKRIVAKIGSDGILYYS